jgi:hypothetical protein
MMRGGGPWWVADAPGEAADEGCMPPVCRTSFAMASNQSAVLVMIVELLH